ncbi:MAG: T9SS type A sorting domain-containing protein [Saprospiraceae bacterium]|nr:T9SS type A sorting domain-containing protein [Candidatus Defluviibacterium haderslevense]
MVSNGYHFLGINPKTSLFTWGNNESGQLGSDTKKMEIDPVQLTRSTKFKKVALGINHSHVLKEDGFIWATGANSFGQLGIGNNADVSTLTAIYCLPVNSVLDKTFSSEISIYPNPAHNLLRIELGLSASEPTDISICDLNGKSINIEFIKKQVNSKNQQMCIDLTCLNSGLYYVKINSNKGTVIKKIIKN